MRFPLYTLIIENRGSLEEFFQSKCAAKNWHNFLLLRVILLPSVEDSAPVYIYQKFFGTDGPRLIIGALSNWSKMAHTFDSETQVGY